MSDQDTLEKTVADTNSLAEFLEATDAPTKDQASAVIKHVWGRDVPQKRAEAILNKERERLAQFENVSFTQNSRAPRYMDLTDLELVSGHEFEHILAEVLSRIEGSATVTKASGDQGVDVVWFRDTETIGIQAKAYNKDNPVGNSAVQEIFTGSKVLDLEYSIDKSAVVTTSRYTESAIEAAEKSGVRLYGRSQLSQWLSEAKLDAEAMGDLLDRIR
ncbi:MULTISPECIES: restriction endonuclease [Haloferax]|uniref:Restriction endonuclease type IV Mrr domain-containing protein n=2 Tax=Haloferax TaxID=2251 RepID=A0A6G1Z715_9EURY|nr:MULTISPECIES: restriction endonuclease [Haloferax]KAB1184796.1 restriction endonuclease [Haloferax sp. CBA1149]MRW82427.1 hypothetical protein [Haloferax marinisediminis]